MTTATVTALPQYRQVAMPVVCRDERMGQLIQLAGLVLDGPELPDWLIRREVNVLAHKSLRYMAPMRAWTSYIKAEERFRGWAYDYPSGGESDLEAGMAEDDRDNALAVLLDGERS